jgi:hypothetical protein
MRAVSKGEYFTLAYEYKEFRPADIEGNCTVYVHGQKHYHGRTWEEAIEKIGHAIDHPVTYSTEQEPA